MKPSPLSPFDLNTPWKEKEEEGKKEEKKKERKKRKRERKKKKKKKKRKKKEKRNVSPPTSAVHGCQYCPNHHWSIFLNEDAFYRAIDVFSPKRNQNEALWPEDGELYGRL